MVSAPTDISAVFLPVQHWSANFKMVWYVLLQPLRKELDGPDQVQIIVT
jgi:hypothetical protein